MRTLNILLAALLAVTLAPLAQAENECDTSSAPDCANEVVDACANHYTDCMAASRQAGDWAVWRVFYYEWYVVCDIIVDAVDDCDRDKPGRYDNEGLPLD